MKRMTKKERKLVLEARREAKEAVRAKHQALLRSAVALAKSLGIQNFEIDTILRLAWKQAFGRKEKYPGFLTWETIVGRTIENSRSAIYDSVFKPSAFWTWLHKKPAAAPRARRSTNRGRGKR